MHSTHSHLRRRPSVMARILSVAAALAFLGSALAGCSGSSDEATPNPDYTTKPTDSFPVTVEHKFGTTVIDEEPQRVVVVGLTEQDILLELGVTPIATTEWYGEQPYAVWPWATDLLGDAKPAVLDQTDGLQYEKIAALEPDLIVGTNAGLTKNTYDKLSKIAPTVTSVKGSEGYFSDWKAQTRQVAAAVGRSTTVSNLGAVTGHRAVFTDTVLAGAIYFLTPLSQKYVVEHLVPRLVDAVNGTAPQSTEG